MVKKYSETAFEELISSLKKHVDSGNSIHVFIKMINELEEKYPGLKNIFIHDMGSFMTHWFDIVNDSNRCSTKLRAKILTLNFMENYSDFNKLCVFLYDKVDDEVNPHTNRPYVNDFLSYLSCIIKAIIQSTRRKIGLDNNSKKHATAK